MSLVVANNIKCSKIWTHNNITVKHSAACQAFVSTSITKKYVNEWNQLNWDVIKK